MGLHLAEISARVTPGKHCALLVDQAGWHISERLTVPSNITIVPLPAKCPELNPVENVWQFMRDNWLSNRVFRSYDAIVDHCCYAWNQLVDRPWRVMSIGLRDWAMGPAHGGMRSLQAKIFDPADRRWVRIDERIVLPTLNVDRRVRTGYRTSFQPLGDLGILGPAGYFFGNGLRVVCGRIGPRPQKSIGALLTRQLGAADAFSGWPRRRS